jgi:hypothetical protein
MNNMVEEILAQRGFIHKKNESYSYIYTRTWENSNYEFTIVSDRGYYEAFVMIKDKNSVGGEIIKFIRRVSNDSQLFESELEGSDRYRTFQPERYAEIFDQYYEEIDRYRETYEDIAIKYNGNELGSSISESVKEVNRFWGSVQLRYSMRDFNTVILSQEKNLNISESIFKLGQKVGHKNCNNKLMINALKKANRIKVISENTTNPYKIKITTEFGVIEAYKGVLQDADSYMMRKITNRIQGKYKDEITNRFLTNNVSPTEVNQKVGYLTSENQLLFFESKEGELKALAVYQISVSYE